MVNILPDTYKKYIVLVVSLQEGRMYTAPPSDRARPEVNILLITSIQYVVLVESFAGGKNSP